MMKANKSFLNALKKSAEFNSKKLFILIISSVLLQSSSVLLKLGFVLV